LHFQSLFHAPTLCGYLASSQDAMAMDLYFQCSSLSCINCFYNSGFATGPGSASAQSLSYPCTKESRNPSRGNTKEHCQMASSHQAGPVAWQECECALYMAASLQPASPYSPTAHSHSKTLCVNHS
jgi:hypothetical protein